MSLMEIHQLNYTYPTASHPTLINIDLQVQEGELVLLTGASGSGKSTLLRVMAGLVPRFYGGHLQGEVKLLGRSLPRFSHRELSSKVAMLFQDPESQLVTTRVDQEIVFGMENLGYSRKLMGKRRMEAGQATGLMPWMSFPIPHLSGGWKQRTALASVMAIRPHLLLLDEPLSQLEEDSIDQLFDYLQKGRREWGMSTVIAEHRIDNIYERMDQIVQVKDGQINVRSEPLVNACETQHDVQPRYREQNPGQKQAILDQVDYYYQTGHPILRGIDLNLESRQITALTGGNGAGKTTLLRLLMGFIKPVSGQVYIGGEDPCLMSAEKLARKIGYLSQEPGDYLFSATVRDEIMFTCRSLGIDDRPLVETLLDQFRLGPLADQNPRDLSWGERQRTALASILAARPDILLLDEPTRGLDRNLRNELGAILESLADNGASILIVTHDREFARSYAERLLLLKSGELIEL